MARIHDHQHSHDAAAAQSAAGRHKRRLVIVFALLAGFFVIEAATALATGSLTLLSDAGHMAGDALGLGVSLAAVHIANAPRRRPGHTFGLYRLEVMAAVANAGLLLLVAGYVLAEAVRRVAAPAEVLVGPMLAVAVLGLGVNLVALRLLRVRVRASLTIEAAALEVFADTIGSIGAIVAGVILATTGWPYIDPLVGAAIAVFIVPRAVRLGRHGLRVLVQAAPSDLEPGAVHADLAGLDDVVDVHDLHVWTLTSGMNVASAHLMVPSGADLHSVLDRARDLLRDRYAIDHATLQVEPDDHKGCDELRW
jgi:cobalt-zinc-cadmium efflux system protein